MGFIPYLVCLPSTALYKLIYYGNACLKKCVLSRDLKIFMSFAVLMLSGMSFQYLVAAKLKPLSTNDFFLFNGISRVMPVDVDCLVVLW